LAIAHQKVTKFIVTFFERYVKTFCFGFFKVRNRKFFNFLFQ